MAPQVKKAKTAFLYYQSDQLSVIRKELNLSMGDAMTEVRTNNTIARHCPVGAKNQLLLTCQLTTDVLKIKLAARWRSLTDEYKQKYLDLEAQDRERYERESAQADAERLEEQEARRKALTVQEGEDSRSRGARQKLDEERRLAEEEREQRREQREADMDPEERAERDRIREEKRRETEERQRLRDEEDKAMEKMQKKLDKEQAKKAASRLEYLFKQSPIFAKLKMGKGNMDDEPEEEEEEKKDNGSKTRARPKKDDGNKPHHIHDKDSSAGEEEDDEDDKEQHVFLTKQPSCIKFGQLKPYQLESLNWMIHLAEKGLNGILADEVSEVPIFAILSCLFTRSLLI